MRIILASASPRRKELLAQIGLEFEIVVSDVEEKVTSTLPWQVVEELSAQKAEAVCNTVCGESGTGNSVSDNEMLVIGADTIVAYDEQILGKPRDEENAKEMLRSLQGRAHQVYTGVTLIHVKDGQRMVNTFHERTDVEFYPMTEQDIADYVATGDPMDKAGAYGIQGICARFVKGIRGDYNNVVGLPVGRLYQEAKNIL